jgi:hypothetical protein
MTGSNIKGKDLTPYSVMDRLGELYLPYYCVQKIGLHL